ncbi:hypothetical protein [Brachyspira hyodysenteriae]|uniref:TPR domain-containing protein n=2 Tax=Brachyspira hyodysenteriae TaxID=159 RepID=A0A3B6V8R7_BRAHW|nr:hypothetical protein [Brachyspira hyodysenteriae]ACN83185.1 hypothetical protein BHWA1_00691 [Brachyspira hyodysenteriae WA1]ANN64701.1 hypothetical protein BHYOB78_12770 [Brachyspira hyodysenteriae ATCC 27164]KLI14940.1 hypothetical protein SU45_10345 [Brachyspira hyodysenteriae]KLI20303.1 hypothetical protein SU43_12400 [Brachyspira hyodysenteriae]KLI23494.1 hypothetical protein SZ47_10760 [Brachyspira hyodysenteriae]
MNEEELIQLKENLFNGEYADILKPLSSGNVFLAKSVLTSYIKDFSSKRKLQAIALFTSNNYNFYYEDDGSVLRVIEGLINNKNISAMDNISFDLTVNNALLYGDFLRFVYALYFGGLKEELTILLNRMHEFILIITSNIVLNFKIANLADKLSIYITSSIYRYIFDVFSDFYDIYGDLQNRADVMYHKSYITCNVMSDYKALVGPDLIKTALCFEDIKDFEKSEKIYESIIIDFEYVLSEIMCNFDNYNVKNKAEDYVALISLWQACNGINRLENINKYDSKIESIEEAINKLNSI